MHKIYNQFNIIRTIFAANLLANKMSLWNVSQCAEDFAAAHNATY